jgi:hypothetical protein
VSFYVILETVMLIMPSCIYPLNIIHAKWIILSLPTPILIYINCQKYCTMFGHWWTPNVHISSHFECWQLTDWLTLINWLCLCVSLNPVFPYRIGNTFSHGCIFRRNNLVA